MNGQEIEAALNDALHRIAPDIARDDVDPDADLREEYDIDSVDFLNLVTALGKHFSLEMPEADYSQMDTYAGLLAYLQKKLLT